MKGHLKERSAGRWAIFLDGRDANGKRKRRWHAFAGTKRQAQLECARLIAEIQKGIAIEPPRLNVAEYLSRGLEHIRPQVAQRPHERYAEIVRASLVPPLGGMLLTKKLQPMAISAAYAAALLGGRR